MTKIEILFARVKERAFTPDSSIFLMWLLIAPTFLLALAITFILQMHPACGVLFLLSVVSIWSFWKASKKWSTLYCIAITLFFLFSLLTWDSMQSGFQKLWGWGLLFSILTSYMLISEVREYFQNRDDLGEEAAKERDLWRSRFETYQEKHATESLEMQEMVDASEKAQEELHRHVESLRRLIEVSQDESRLFAKEKYQLIDDLKLAKAEMPLETSEKKDTIEREEVMKLLDELNHYKAEHYQLQDIIEEYRKKFLKPNEPFQWQRWCGPEKNENSSQTKAKITLKDLTK